MKILSSVPKDHFEKNNVTIPEEWDVVFIDHKFRRR